MDVWNYIFDYRNTLKCVFETWVVHIPFKCVRVRPARKPWITVELMKLISPKKRMFKNCRNNHAQWGEYKEFRNVVLLQIRQAKNVITKL